MATESPMRIVESSRGRNWPSNKNTETFGPPFKSMVAEEFGLLLKGHNFYGDQADTIPNRSGSAPPSMEGSLAAISNLLAQQDSSLSTSLASLSNALENCESEEQLRSDPAYFAYYCSNVNLNPRLPPPLMSRENRRLVRHIGGFSPNWRLTSSDDSGSGSLHLSRGSLSTHNEEPEDDSSSGNASGNMIENSNAVSSWQDMASMTSRHKSLVDLIQEDFPRTPSPVYSQTISSGRATTEEVIDSNVQTISFKSLNISEVPEPNSDDCLEANPTDVHSAVSMSNKGPLASSSPSSQYPDESRSPKKDSPRDTNPHSEGGSGSCLGPDFSKAGSRPRASNLEISGNRPEQQSYGKNISPLHLSAQQGVPYQHHGFQPNQHQIISQGMNHLASGMEHLSLNHPKFSSEGKTSLHSPVTPSLYAATSAAYMSPGSSFYPNFQQSGLYAPQYSMSGYALGSTLFPPFMTGYPPHGAVPLPYNTTSGPNFNGRTAAVSIGESVAPVSDLQNLSKLYGHPGLIFQPSFLDPLHMQYFPPPAEDPYGTSVQHAQFATRGVSQVQGNSMVSQPESSNTGYVGDQRFPSSSNGSFGISSPRKIVNSSYYGNPSNMGIITQFPVSPHASPVLPSSPIGGTAHLGRRSEIRFPQGSARGGVYSGWQGQRGLKSFDDPKRHSFLEELKSSNSRKFELSDIAGRIVEFSVDQHGSRFIQQKLESCSPEDKASVFKEVLPHAARLMTDVFGNYVIQKFFEHGTPEQRKELAGQLAGQMLPLSLQMYGCRVIQKALEVIDLDQKTRLVRELDGHVMRCVHDQNGNHVIQKCIECVPTEKIEFIISSFRGQVPTLSTHPYGCRVIQRVLEHCSDEEQCQCIVDEILESACVLAQDQYGNYVTQHVLERGKPRERSQIISKLTGKVVEMSQHKYASNVVEKCLEHGSTSEQELLIDEIIGESEENDNLLTMMKDQFANYVVQKILEISNDKQREILLGRIRVNLQALKKYTYGKHIVARFEQLAGEGSQASSEP